MGYSCVLLVQVCPSLDKENSPGIFHNPLIISVFDVAVRKRDLLLFVEANKNICTRPFIVFVPRVL